MQPERPQGRLKQNIAGGLRLAWQASPREVAAVLELPLAELAGARTRTQMTRRGFTFETDAYVLGEHLIWGATARILDELLQRIDGFLA